MTWGGGFVGSSSNTFGAPTPTDGGSIGNFITGFCRKHAVNARVPVVRYYFVQSISRWTRRPILALSLFWQALYRLEGRRGGQAPPLPGLPSSGFDSITSPMAISTMSLASWAGSRERLGRLFIGCRLTSLVVLHYPSPARVTHRHITQHCSSVLQAAC